MNEALENKSVGQLALIIQADWKKPYFGAVPYLNAMKTLHSVGDRFFAEGGHEIVLRFLANATFWRGSVAREVKAELKRRVGR
jgi:hypothetical protein